MHYIDQATTEAIATTTSSTARRSLAIAGSTITLAGTESAFSCSTTKYDFWLVPPATEKSVTDRFHRCFITFSSVANGKHGE
jgi:hypothetical protein